jgi:predicted O-methyltransferase YrrM
MAKYTFIFLLLFSFTSSHALADSNKEQSSPKPTRYYLNSYNFSEDWFTENIPVWLKVLRPFKGKPDLHYLEIGIFEGRSAIWMLENILTHPSSRLTGIDIFPKGTDWKEKYLSNLNISGFAHKATTIEGYSQTELKNLPVNSFDIIYIDGCHRADCALSDAVLSFELLKTGGILIFDDYQWKKWFPEELRPKIAIDSFVTAYRNYVKVVHRGYQVFIKKQEGPCASLPKPRSLGCSPIGQYLYFWYFDDTQNKLSHKETGESVKLSAKEKLFIERLATSKRFGETGLFLDKQMSKDKDFINLTERLKLDLTNAKIK